MSTSGGDHAISACFGYEVEGGFFSGRRILIYHLADPEKPDRREPLATLGVGYIGAVCYRPAMYAVSSDGRVLLYRHEKTDHTPAGLEKKPPGLYEFTHGSGERLLHPDVGHDEAGPLPRDAILFSLGGGPLEPGEPYVRTTSGDEYPYEVRGGNALHVAAYLGQTERLAELLSSGLDLEARDARGFTPLLEAIWAGRTEAVRSLLDHGASLDVTVPKLEWSPLDEAARFGHDDIVDVLLDRGVDVNAKDALGKTAHDIALSFGKRETAEHLVQRGAQVPAIGR
jgi:hypothetical protein